MTDGEITSLSSRSAFTGERTALDRAAAERRAAGLPLVDLTIGNPTVVSFPDADDLVAELGHPRGTTYRPEAFGELAPRRAIAARHEGVDAADVMLTASTSEAYAFAFQVLADVGDDVLVPRPSYPLLDWLAELSGVRLVGYPLRYDGAWHVDVAAVAAACTAKTKAIVVVSPNNPTGSYLHEDEWDALVALAKSRGLALLVDEVFFEYPLTNRPVKSAAGETRALTFTMGGLSKMIGMPQLKLAWTILSGPRPLVNAVRERLAFVADTFLSAATPVQLALPTLLVKGETRRRAILDRVTANLATLRRALADTTATVLDVEGGWYAVVRLPALASDDEWALRLLARGVLVQPGHLFDFEDDARVIVSLLPLEDDFAAGVAIIRDALAI